MRAHHQPPTPLLRVTGVCVAGHGLIDVSFQVHAGSRHAIVVPAAAGTALLEVIAGISYPDRGQVYLDGQPVTGRPASKLIRENIGYLPATPRWHAAPTVHGVLQSAVRWQVLARRHPGALSGPQQVTDTLHRCGLHEYADTCPNRLPPGWSRMLDLAVIVLHRPRLILVDQATTGLADQTLAFRRVLTDVPDTVAVLSTVPTLHDIAGLADHLTVIDNGRIIEPPTIGTADR